MNGNIIEINEDKVKDHLGNFVRQTVEETLNAMLDVSNGDRVPTSSGEKVPLLKT